MKLPPFAGLPVLLFAATTAFAQLGPNGAPIRTSEYKVDLTQGPVLAGTRVTGLAGSYVALGEGVDGMIQTPVSPAVRAPYSRDHFDYDLGLGFVLPSGLSNMDYFNTGRGKTDLSRSNPTQIVFLTPAFLLQFGDWGFGASVELQRYGLTRGDVAGGGAVREELEGNLGVIHLQLAKSFFDGQFVVGVGTRATSLTVNDLAGTRAEPLLFETTGAGLEFGALVAPNGLPLRLGASFRTAVTPDADPSSSLDPEPGTGDLILEDAQNPAADCRTDPAADCLWLPREVTLPWDLNVGLAVQVGPRPLNVPFDDPSRLSAKPRRYFEWRAAERDRRREAADALPSHARAAQLAELDHEQTLDELAEERMDRETDRALRARYLAIPRRYILASMSLLVQGPVDRGVGIESFLQRRVDRSGEAVTLSPRLGLEGEPVAGWVKLRAGTYGEPTRFDNGVAAARLHGTFGLDLKVLPWTVFGLFEDGTWWRAAGSLDVARRYLSWGVSVGLWH